MQTQEEVPFYRKEHLQYLLSLESSKDLNSIGKYLTEHLKIAGAYWSLTSISLFSHELPPSTISSIIQFIKGCQNPDGGFGGNIGHDSHMTSTHYAVLVLLNFG